MFSTFSSWVTSATDAVNKISDQSLDAVRHTGLMDVLQNASPQTGAVDAAANQQALHVSDLMTPPTTWMGSSDEWRWCMEAALADANTCAITPATLKGDANLWQEIHTTLTNLAKSTESGAESFTALMDNITAEYSPAADLVAFIQAHAAIYQVRSYVVPLFTSDENYWLNIGWRLSLYRLCTNASELLKVMRTLSKLPAGLHDIADAEERAAAEAAAARASKLDAANSSDSDGDDESEEGYRAKPHLKGNGEFWAEKERQHAAEQDKFTWLRETQERVRKEMELARGNVKLLGSLLQRQEASSALAVSVSDSCKYHKVKLSRLIGDISAASEEQTKGTVLDSETGTLFHELFECNEDVRSVLDAYASRGQEVSTGSPKTPTAAASSPVRASPNRESAPVREPSVPAVESAAATTPKAAASAPSSSAVELSAGGSSDRAEVERTKDGDDDGDDSGEDGGSFEAKLPWSMDD